jgi:hypothetical protein
MVDYLRSEAKQAARERFTGLWAALTTPFGARGELDEAALRRDLDRLTGELRIDGVFCGGVMSEFGGGWWRWSSNAAGGGARYSRTPATTAPPRRSS